MAYGRAKKQAPSVGALSIMTTLPVEDFVVGHFSILLARLQAAKSFLVIYLLDFGTGLSPFYFPQKYTLYTEHPSNLREKPQLEWNSMHFAAVLTHSADRYKKTRQSREKQREPLHDFTLPSAFMHTSSCISQ